MLKYLITTIDRTKLQPYLILYSDSTHPMYEFSAAANKKGTIPADKSNYCNADGYIELSLILGPMFK